MTAISLQQWEATFISYLQQHTDNSDAAHDISHFTRVWNTCRIIDMAEGNKGDLLVLLTASYFHDLVAVAKNSPDRNKASLLSAEKTSTLLRTLFEGYPQDKIESVAHAIHAHSFSAGITPLTYEARVLQDADRMEALGAIGIARTFYVAGLLHSQMFHAQDPLAQNRPLDDKTYALDHFQVKLLKLPAQMNTESGKKLAEERSAILTNFMKQLAAEATGR